MLKITKSPYHQGDLSDPSRPTQTVGLPGSILLLSLLVSGSLLFLSSPVHAFKTNIGGAIHRNITFILKSEGFEEESLKFVIQGNELQDVDGKNFADPIRHFDNNTFPKAVQYVYKIQNEIIQMAPGAVNNANTRQQILLKFGALLHSVQDFYSHSNYVELHLKEHPDTQVPLISWLAPPKGLRTGYYTNAENVTSIPNILKTLQQEHPSVKFKHEDSYKGFLSDDYTYRSYEKAIENATGSSEEMHYYLNKDNDQTPMGKVLTAKKYTLYNIAYNTAQRETMQQWRDLMAQLKAHYGSRAADMIYAIEHNENIKPTKSAPAKNDGSG